VASPETYGRAGILPSVEYSVGSRIRVKLYSGQIVDAEIAGYREPIGRPQDSNFLREQNCAGQSRTDHRSSTISSNFNR
jgi:hypothetical protein